MLTSLKIQKLFGLYDYNLTFSKTEKDKMRFITGTNGYGKSTVLHLINALFNQHLEVFFKVPFQELQFCVDGAILQVSKTTAESPQDSSIDDSTIDAEKDSIIIIGIGEKAISNHTELTINDIQSGSKALNTVLQQIELFFSSESCKFIDDHRLLRENTDSSELVRLSEVVKERLNHPDEKVNQQIRVLQDIVNRSEFANKHFELNPSFGFRFVVDNEDRTKLAMSDLSSGEQHIMLLTLYMLFEAPEKAIVLIDEPEMSFHLSWQGDYLRNLRQIVALRNIQCIIATHSPIIFDSEYDLTIDLYDQMNPEQ